MKYSKKVREEAALICAIAASSNIVSLYKPIQRNLGSSPMGFRLACRAYLASHFYGGDSCVRDAEAEALIRTGWTP